MALELALRPRDGPPYSTVGPTVAYAVVVACLSLINLVCPSHSESFLPAVAPPTAYRAEALFPNIPQGGGGGAGASHRSWVVAQRRISDIPSSPSTTKKKRSASVTCNCGKAKIVFGSTVPMCAVECCCCDCNNAIRYCESVGGPTPTCGPPALLNYIDNDIVSTVGEEFMELYRLRDSSGSIRIKTNCCHTHLLTTHFFYLRKRVLVLPNCGCNFQYEGDEVKPYVRLHTKFWNETVHGPLSPFEGELGEEKSDSAFWPFRCELIQRMVMPPQPERKGEGAQALIRRLQEKKDVIVAGLEEPALEGYFKTGGGMFSLTLKNPLAKEADSKCDQHGLAEASRR